ncbi:MAG: glycosyltransferase family 39 protein [bacterium]|nr:glycosyltransferase family 39 protein [bacterium]
MLFKTLFNDWFKLSLILITLLGLAIRIFFLNTRPITYDEGQSLMFTRTDLVQLVKGTMADAHPPGYFLLIYFWAKINSSLSFIRFLSVIFGIVTIFIAGGVGKKLLGNKAGILTALLVSLSPVYIFESTNARMYSLSVLASFLIINFFFNFLKKQNLLNSFLLGLTLLVGIYIHYYFVFAIFALSFSVLFVYPQYKRKWFQLLTIILIFAFPLFIGYLKSDHPLFLVSNSLLKIPGLFVTFLISWDAIQVLKIYPFPGLNNLLLSSVLIIFLSLFFCILGMKRIAPQKALFQFLTVYLLLPILVVLLISYAVKPILGIRSFIIFSPAFYLVLAKGLETKGHKLTKIGLVVFVVLFLFGQYQGFKNTLNLYAPFNYVFEDSSPGDLYAYSDPYFLTIGRYYIESDRHISLVPTWIAPEMANAMGYVETDWENNSKDTKQLWYFRLEDQYYKGDQAEKVQKELEVKYPVVFTKEYPDLKLNLTLFDLRK